MKSKRLKNRYYIILALPWLILLLLNFLASYRYYRRVSKIKSKKLIMAPL